MLKYSYNSFSVYTNVLSMNMFLDENAPVRVFVSFHVNSVNM